MKNTIKYKINGLKESYEATLTDFIIELKEYLPFNKVPPYQVLNLYLMENSINSGMGGEMIWEPFTIDIENYNLHILKLTEKEFYNAPEKLLISILDWETWCEFVLFGIPIDQNKELKEKVVMLETEYDKAYDSENFKLADKLDWDKYLIVEKLNELTSKYVTNGCNPELIPKFKL